MFKVPYRQDPYSAIGKYIQDHITVIEDIIAVIKINEVETNQLFMVDTSEENYFIWNTDWWEGEEDVTLIDFFPVSEAQRANQSVQSADTISRQAAIDALGGNEPVGDPSKMDDDDVVKMWERIRIINIINKLPSAQPEPAIPLSWIESKIEWFKSLDNECSLMAAGAISALVNIWKKEQKEGD